MTSETMSTACVDPTAVETQNLQGACVEVSESGSG